MNSIRHRLDSLEAYPSWFFVRLLLLAGFSWAVNAAECVLFVKTRQPMAKSTRLRTFAVEAMGGGLLIGAAVGGPLFGRIADTRGRRWALLLAKILSLAGLMLCAMARKDYEVISARILAGIGLGGELTVAATWVHELTPIAMRGRMVALLEAFTGVGGVAGVMLSFVVMPHFGWRIAYLTVSGGIFYVGMLCARLPESPRWLASAGREAEAMAVMMKLERAHGTRLVYDSVMVQEAPTAEVEESGESMETVKLSVLDKPVDAVVQWALWIVLALSSYALGVYVPVLIGLWGFNMLSGWSTMVLLHVSQVLGSVLASLVLEEHGLNKALPCFGTGAAVAAIMLSYAPWQGPIVVVGTCTVSALLAASWSCVLVYAPTKFTTEIRGRGVGYAFGFSRLSAIGGSRLYPHMFNIWRVSVPAITLIFAGLLVAFVLGVIVPYGHSSIDVPSDHNSKGEVRADEKEEALPHVVNHSLAHKSRKNE
ncbi:hypothetical protein PHYPSEUDO_003029 [Phytophthora pseudosyringae]|uniref:Major facilitator superfamily (MFS) profile domain-containing protein n=1 Tax=Phytophthora pseudosyringae TaxID=221518 RepID=A0A8T1V2P7_9STRA|nr:hypothetical protein PHYPSEUDO_003029 [Phytophthora pseudosyringae]